MRQVNEAIRVTVWLVRMRIVGTSRQGFAVTQVTVPTSAVRDFYDRQRQDRERDYPSPACSLITLRASLSSRSPANFECRRWSEGVHSRNSIRATISGLTQMHLSMSAAVNLHPNVPYVSPED